LRLIAQFERLRRAEQGASLVELAMVVPFLFLLLIAAVDFGRMYFLAIEVAGAAEAGATYGSQHPSDTAGMKVAAQNDAPDVPNLVVNTPTYGCECSDGTLFSASCATTPSCTHNVVYRVTVTVTASYTSMIPWTGIPSTINLSNTATMRSGGS